MGVRKEGRKEANALVKGLGRGLRKRGGAGVGGGRKGRTPSSITAQGEDRGARGDPLLAAKARPGAAACPGNAGPQGYTATTGTEPLHESRRALAWADGVDPDAVGPQLLCQRFGQPQQRGLAHSIPGQGATRQAGLTQVCRLVTGEDKEGCIRCNDRLLKRMRNQVGRRVL